MNDLTETFVMGRLITDDDSLRNYYLGDSYQMQDISAKVARAVQLPAQQQLRHQQLTSTLKPMVDAQVGGPSQHYLWFFGSQTSSCNWSGLASVGTPQKPSRDTWYNHSVGCVVLVQEPGHNFGMQHSSSLTCGTSNMLRRPEQRLHGERVRRLVRSDGRRLPPHERLAEELPGLVRGCNGVRVTNSGTFNLLPFEMACNGDAVPADQGAQARPFMRPAAGGGSATTENLDYYYLELRTPVDFDGTLGGSALSARCWCTWPTICSRARSAAFTRSCST